VSVVYRERSLDMLGDHEIYFGSESRRNDRWSGIDWARGDVLLESGEVSL